MKKTTLALLAIAALPHFAFGLGATNCVSANGDYTRMEEEIWGANKVGWFRNGEQLEVDTEKFDPKTVVPLIHVGGQDEYKKMFSAKVTLTNKKKMKEVVKNISVTCGSWKDKAVDLVAPKPLLTESNLGEVLKLGK